MASNNNHNNNNQPRRKRNKKPVKRYSEEYNNRPNPYTGYSSDGNYHPGAKKRSISEASAANTSNTAKNGANRGADSRYDYSRVAMTDAVWPPANAPQNQPAAKPVPTTAAGVAEGSAPTEQGVNAAKNTKNTQAEASAADGNIAELAETAARLENAGNAASAHKSGSHRKKHTNKQAAEQARKAKMEAKKAALDKMAQGVAAHSVSEQMIDDISNMSEAMESAAKAEKSKQVEQAIQNGGVNWDELYDAAFPPKESEPEPEKSEPKGKGGKNGKNGKGKKAKAKKQRLEFDEVSEQNQPMLVKPVMLGENEALPYDLIVEENAREAEEARAAEEAKAKAIEETRAAEQKRLAEADTFQNPPLEPSDLIPVLDFEKLDRPVLDLSEPVSADIEEKDDEADDALEDIIDVAGTVSIMDIINAVEQEKLDAAAKAEAAHAAAAAELAAAAPSEFAFDTEKSEGWHEITPPPIDESAEEPADDTPAEDDSVSLLSQRLLESYMEIEDQPLEYMPEDSDDDILPEGITVKAEPTETVDLNAFFAPAADTEAADDIPASEPTQAIEVEVEPEPEEITVDTIKEAALEQAAEAETVDIDIAEIEDEIFAETDISSLEEEAAAETEEESASGEDAVKEKIEKLVEAAELAEVLRQESEDILPEEASEPDVFAADLPTGSLPESEEVSASRGDEVIKEYRVREKPPKDENVFESVLIVDDSRSAVDSETAKKQDDMQFLHAAAVPENPTAVFRLPDGPLVLPADVDDADFQEQWLDEEEDGDEMATRTKRTRRRISAFIGGVAMLFVAMILVYVLGTVITGFNNIGSTNEKKVEYSEFIAPVVLNDPAPFETIDKADNQMLLESAIWRVLTEMSETEDYEYTYDATNKIVIPADKVEQAGRALFGSEVQLNMNVLSESDGSAIYYYDSIDNSFHISTGGIMGPSAIITKMAQKSDYVSLVVGYVSQDEISLTSSDDEIECYKYMEYVLALKPDSSYYIQSIRNYVED